MADYRDWLNPSVTQPYGVDTASIYRTSADPYATREGTINDITGAELLEVIQKGLYKTLVGRRDDAKAVWEEEDDDAAYGEYKALKDAVELLEGFLKQAPKSRYSGLKNPDYNRYDGYGNRY